MLVPNGALHRDHIESSKVIENNRKYYNLIGETDIRYSKELNQFDKLTDELLNINHLKIK